MKFKVDPWNNFCRVFEIPEEYPKGYCFGAGKPVTMMMVDWFNPCEGINQAAVTKEVSEEKVGPVAEQVVEIEGDVLVDKIEPFLQSKKYTKPGRKYLVVCDFGLAFTLEK
jgi:hypothetical protein